MKEPSRTIKRAILSLLITCATVMELATMPIEQSSPSVRVGIGKLPKTALTLMRTAPAPNVPYDTHDVRLLQCAFASSIADLLGTWVIPLEYKSENVVTNVTLAASSIDFTVLHPGEEFSFNRIVGIRSPEKGYKPGGVYSNGEMIQGIGGGICMVSTALYNLALEAGLKIIERHPHSGPIDYADPGRDAAVSFGWADLRFKNNTDGLLIIRCMVKDNRLITAFYGRKKPGQRIEIISEDYEELPFETIRKEDPTLSQGEFVVKKEGRPGFRVTTVRVFWQNNELVKREIISTDTILPKNRIVLVPASKQDTPEPLIAEPLPAIRVEERILPEFPEIDSTKHEALPLFDTAHSWGTTTPEEPLDGVRHEIPAKSLNDTDLENP